MREFRILGQVEVVEGDRTIPLGGPKQRAVLAILLLHRGQVVSSDRLTDELWGERPPATAAKTLQGYVSHLRRALGDGVVLTRGGGYLLDPAAGELDADRFETLVADARAAMARGDAAGGRERLETALSLWRGEALADVAYEPFAQGEITRLEEARLSAVEDRIDADLRLGAHRSLVGELEALVDRHPHRERLLGQLMVALYRSGRQSEALEAYGRAREALDRDLGLEPGPELRGLQQQVLAQDPALDAPASVHEPPPRGAPHLPRRTRRALIGAGGALLLLAGIAAGIIAVAGGGAAALTVAPNSVAAIDIKSDRVIDQVPVGARPGPIAYGARSLWVANQDDQTISRVNPKTLQTLRTIPVSDPPTALAFAGGHIWVVDSEPSATFVTASSIDPEFDLVGRAIRIGNVVPDTAAAAAADGNELWVAPFSGELTQLDPDSGGVIRQLNPNSGPTGMAIGAGAVWITDAEAGNVVRVDPTGLLSTIATGDAPSGIAVGDGAVWVADTGDDAVVRIDPDSQAVTSTIPVGEAPSGVTVGGGSVWVADSGDGTVTRIDPDTDRVVATIRVGGSPQTILVAAGRAWVTVDAPVIPRGGLAPSGGTLRMDAPEDVDYMDPALAYQGLSWDLLYVTCAKLLNYPDKAGLAGAQLVPEVAQALPAVSDGGRTYTFRIRPGFRFSPPSNAPVTAQTFSYTIERALNPVMKNPVAAEFDDIVGARAYIAGRASHISGVAVRGDTLTIRLTAPAPDLEARLAQPFFCAVPVDTPLDPQGLRDIPSAGPYYVVSYAPGEGVVLARNPNYHGSRPHRPARIELTVNVSGARAVAQVEAGAADYAYDGEVESSDVAAVTARYGPDSPAARAGHQQYFVEPRTQLSFYVLNSNRPLFADVRMRQAVNFAIDRSALAQLGFDGDPLLPAPPIDHYLPPGIPGYRDVDVYPLTPDLARARELARGHAGATAVLDTCDQTPCAQQAQIITTDLAAIGINVQVRTLTFGALEANELRPDSPFDIGYQAWVADYPDPDDLLNLLLEDGTALAPFKDPSVRAKLAAAAQLSGPRRYLTYGQLDLEIARDAAPWIAYATAPSHELFAARIGCQTYGVYGLDLAALCVRRAKR